VPGQDGEIAFVHRAPGVARSPRTQGGRL